MDKKIIFLFFLILFSLKCFDATFAQTGIWKYITYGYMLVMILASLPFFLKYKGKFILPVQLICAAILFSILMASYSWGQSLAYSATVIPYLMWFAFFYLLR